MLGYCCINTELRSKGIYSSRKINRKNWTLQKCSERTLQNSKDLLYILQWNEKHNIKVFRISSELFPRITDPEINYDPETLPDIIEIKEILKEIREFALRHNHYLSTHPGQFVCIASPNPDTRKKSIWALERENYIINLLDPWFDMDITINIHMGGNYEQTYKETSERFIDSFSLFSPELKTRIVVENDDKGTGWSVKKIYDFIYQSTKIPITFDAHHWNFCHDLTFEESFRLAKSTWKDRWMQVHWSEGVNDKPKHTDYYSKEIPKILTESEKTYIHLECKKKEDALLKYKMNFNV